MILTRRKLTDSTEQLRADFGEYPIHNHKVTECRKISFYIVNTNKINKTLYDLILTIRAIKGDVNPGAFRTLIKNELQKYHDSNGVTWGSIVEMKNQVLTEIYDTTKLQPKPVRFILFSIMSLMAIPLAIYLLLNLTLIFLNFIINFVNSTTTSSISLGFYPTVTFNGNPEIVVQTPVFSRAKYDNLINAITSHEHIHLLQDHYFPETAVPCRSNTFLIEKTDQLESLAKNPSNLRHYQYLLSINEMEARLHEVVLSYYRTYREIPKNSFQFIEMLMGANYIGNAVIMFLSQANHELDNYCVKPFSCRVSSIEIDIALTLNFFKNESTTCDFIYQVLPVMYGNLLFMYGLTEEAIAFKESIESTQFFDYLYGVAVDVEGMPHPAQRLNLPHF